MTKSIESKFRKLTDVEHVLLRPNRYIGTINPHQAVTWAVVDGKMKKQELTWNPGFLKMFDEIITNAVDHSKRPEGSSLDSIRVTVDRKSGEITVVDNGGIPVVVHADYNEHLPTMLFGYLRSGSNFDDDSEEDNTGSGQNGEGASLVNVFSTKFTVKTCDGKKRFSQTWTENMMKAGKPTIIEIDEAKGFTEITYLPDYEHLKMTLDDGNYAKLVKRVYDVAGCNPKIKIYLNGERIQIKSFKDYIGMYTETFEYDDNLDWQVAVAASDDGFEHVSFVNTTETTIGGTHVYYVWSQIANKLREYIVKKHKIDVKPTEIQAHMQVFINARIDRPRYNSQTKEDLVTEVKAYKTSWAPSDKFIKRVIEAGVVDRVLLWAEAKAKAEEMKKLRELNKDISKADPRRVDKFSDAMEDDDRHLCELYLCEGDSARKSIHEARGKNPYIGSFALKGKVLNVMDREMSKILGGKGEDGNKEIMSILKITGLKLGVPVKSIKELRFGKICIFTDSDLDGFHIRSLLKNFFAYFWPELFELGVIYMMNSPLVIATTKGKDQKQFEFSTDHDYEEWAKTAPKHDAERFKGLGTFETPQMKKVLEARSRYLSRVEKLEDADMKGLKLAFSGSQADERKIWLEHINYFADEIVAFA